MCVGEHPKVSIVSLSQGAPGIPRLMLTCFQPKQNVNIIPKIVETFDRFLPIPAHPMPDYPPGWYEKAEGECSIPPSPTCVESSQLSCEGQKQRTGFAKSASNPPASRSVSETSPIKNGHYASLRGGAACGRCPHSIIHTQSFSNTSSICKPKLAPSSTSISVRG